MNTTAWISCRKILEILYNNQRSELIPANIKYPLADVMKILDKHIQHTGRKFFIAYTLLEGVNDSREHAKSVVKLLHGRGSWAHLYHVDLIRYNLSDKTSQIFGTSNRNSIKTFVGMLKSAGLNVSTRVQFGSDINAACGQLCGSENIALLTNKSKPNKA